jgi:hypothetical protein
VGIGIGNMFSSSFSVNLRVKIKEKLKMPIKYLRRHDFGWVGRATANKQLVWFSLISYAP